MACSLRFDNIDRWAEEQLMITLNSKASYAGLDRQLAACNPEANATADNLSLCRTNVEVNVPQSLTALSLLAPESNDRKPRIDNSQEPTTSRRTVNQRIVKRRDRKILSCTQCRERKLKCDKGHPCSRCEESKAPCVYVNNALELHIAPKRVVKRRKRLITVCWTCRERKIPCDKGKPCTQCNIAGFECTYKRFEADISSAVPADGDKGQMRAAEEVGPARQPASRPYNDLHPMPILQHCSQTDIPILNEQHHSQPQGHRNHAPNTSLRTYPVMPDVSSEGHLPQWQAEAFCMNHYGPGAINEGYGTYTHLQSLPPLRDMLSRRAIRRPHKLAAERNDNPNHTAPYYHGHRFEPLGYGQSRHHNHSSGLHSSYYPNTITSQYHEPSSSSFVYNYASSRTAFDHHTDLIKIDPYYDSQHTTTDPPSYSHPITFQYNRIEHHNYSSTLPPTAVTQPFLTSNTDITASQHYHNKHHTRPHTLLSNAVSQPVATMKQEALTYQYNHFQHYNHANLQPTVTTSQPHPNMEEASQTYPIIKAGGTTMELDYTQLMAYL